ncbi:hypothetical protein B296_00011746 [Ensete ventricosum]|uniref:Uncharacterized protein n=1 Tax=Ensete ventricosum TaxID=4639 RepID=A0A426XV11_ENSVE|nr:hypothetical protein B296_00011746 [Ensete ventricosum]
MQSLKPLKTAWKRRCDPFSPNSALADLQARGNHNTEKLQIGKMILKNMATSPLISMIHACRFTSLDGKKETRSDGSRVQSAIFGSTELATPHGWRLLPSTLREMIFSSLIGLSTPMEDSVGSDSRKDY